MDSCFLKAKVFLNGKQSAETEQVQAKKYRAGKQEVWIYRCCPVCGKGDTPLSTRKYCDMCGSKFVVGIGDASKQ